MKNFIRDTQGNVAVTAALLGIPLMLSAGAAIDYSQLARKNSSLQNVTDSAALAAALLLRDSTQAEVETQVDNFLKSNLSAVQYSEIQGYTVTIAPELDSVTVKVRSKHPTSLMRVAGINALEYAPESVVKAPAGNAEIMLVLDTTGSMSVDGKIDALKVSASGFIEDLLEANKTTERVKIGITPFARYVNVGLDNRDAPWMNVEDDNTSTETVTVRDVVSESNCNEVTEPDVEGVLQTFNRCENVEYGPEYEQEQTVENKWNGCAGSRDYPNNLNDANYSIKVPGPLNILCPSRITQLTNDEDKLKDEISSLTARGVTYIPSGLVWGWRALSSGAPFDDGISYIEAKNQNVQKIIVLMTDGENQGSVSTTIKALHNGTNTVQANQYTQELCNNIKDSEVTVYTIGFGNSIPVSTINLLKECSTDGKNYYNAKDGAALSAAFDSITSNLSALYLSK